MQAQDVSLDEFQGLVSQLTPNTSKIRCKDARAGLALIAETLHVREVAITDVANLYGRSTQGHHVCLVIKNQKGGFAVDLRCSEDEMGANLLSEVKSALKQLYRS